MAVICPDVSVVIPLYNKESSIASCLFSVRSQDIDEQRVELVVVDDGSTDDSLRHAKEALTRKDILIEQANKGVSAARNAGAEAARGRLIAFMDADDEWLPRHLPNLCALHDRFPTAGLLATGYYQLFPDGTTLRTTIRASEPCIIDQFGASRRFSVLTSSSIAVPRHVFQSSGGFKVGVRLGEDVEFWNRISLKHLVAYNPEVTSVYRVGFENSTVQQLHRDESSTQMICGPLIESLQEQAMSDEVRDSILKYVSYRLWEHAIWCINRADKDEALETLGHPCIQKVTATHCWASRMAQAIKWLPLPIVGAYLRFRQSRWGTPSHSSDGDTVRILVRALPRLLHSG